MAEHGSITPGRGYVTIVRSNGDQPVIETFKEKDKPPPDHSLNPPDKDKGGGDERQSGAGIDQPIIDDWKLHVPGLIQPADPGGSDWELHHPGVAPAGRLLLSRSFGDLHRLRDAIPEIVDAAQTAESRHSERPYLILKSRHHGVFHPAEAASIAEDLRDKGLEATVIIQHDGKRST